MTEFIVASLLIFITYFFLIIKFDYLRNILTLVLLTRLLLLVINNFFFYLLDADKDGLNFYKVMLDPSTSGSADLIFADVYFYSKILNYVFKIFEPNIYLAQSFSICFCLISCILFYKLVNFFSEDRKTSLILTAIFSFFPAYMNYSILTMREVFIIFFLMLTTYSFIKIYFENNNKYLVYFILCFFSLFVLHGGTLVGYFFLLTLILIKWFRYFIVRLIRDKRLNIFLIVLMITLSFTVTIPIIDTGFSIPYLRDLSLKESLNFNLIDTNLKIQYISNRSPKSSFPIFLIPENNLEFIFLFIPRYIYFQFAPLFMPITDIKFYVVILVDSLPYLLLVIMIIKNYKIIFKDKKFLIILFLFLILSFTFTVGTFNIGQSVRHRVKFLIFLLILITPIIKKIANHENINFRKK